jgi:hypothetical protein
VEVEEGDGLCENCWSEACRCSRGWVASLLPTAKELGAVDKLLRSPTTVIPLGRAGGRAAISGDRNTAAAEAIRCWGAAVEHEEMDSGWERSVTPCAMSKSDALSGGPSVKMKVSLRLRFAPTAASDCLVLFQMSTSKLRTKRDQNSPDPSRVRWFSWWEWLVWARMRIRRRRTIRDAIGLHRLQPLESVRVEHRGVRVHGQPIRVLSEARHYDSTRSKGISIGQRQDRLLVRPPVVRWCTGL